jgi:hypothetical protein
MTILAHLVGRAESNCIVGSIAANETSLVFHHGMFKAVARLLLLLLLLLRQ